MLRTPLTGQRLVIVFLLGMLLLNFPILGLFEHRTDVWGVPFLYFVIYAIWAVLVLVMAWLAHRARGH